MDSGYFLVKIPKGLGLKESDHGVLYLTTNLPESSGSFHCVVYKDKQ